MAGTHGHYPAGTLLYKQPKALPSGSEWVAASRQRRLAALAKAAFSTSCR